MGCVSSKHNANAAKLREYRRRDAEIASLLATSQQVGEYLWHSFPIEYGDKASMENIIEEKVVGLMVELMGASKRSGQPEEIVAKTADSKSSVALTWTADRRNYMITIGGIDELNNMGVGAWPITVEVKLKPIKPEDPGAALKLFKNTNFADLLARGDIAVVRASYFERCLKKNESFADRANIPEEYFFTGEEVIMLWKRFGYFFLVVISYGWLAKDHPDPDKYHLRRLVRILREWKKRANMKPGGYNEKGGENGGGYDGDVGVILDFCSLWQKDANGDRSEARTASFVRGLKEINTPYAHRNIGAIKMTAVPEDMPRKYEDRGWTFFESSIINGKAESDKDGFGKANVVTFDGAFDPDADSQALTDFQFISKYCKNERKPIITPEDFTQQLDELGRRAERKGVPLFTSGKDQPMILTKYADSFRELATAVTLNYSRMRWTDDEAIQLSKTLQHCHSLQELFLNENAITDTGAEALAKAITGKTHLKLLSLADNKIGDDGAKVLAQTIPICPSLSKVYLLSNAFGDQGRAALTAVNEQYPHIKIALSKVY